MKLIPIIEDRVEELDSAFEACLDSFLWSGLEEVPGLIAIPVARWDWRTWRSRRSRNRNVGGVLTSRE